MSVCSRSTCACDASCRAVGRSLTAGDLRGAGQAADSYASEMSAAWKGTRRRSGAPDPLAYGKTHPVVTGGDGQAVQREAVNARPPPGRDLASPVGGLENVGFRPGAVDVDGPAGAVTRVPRIRRRPRPGSR